MNFINTNVVYKIFHLKYLNLISSIKICLCMKITKKSFLLIQFALLGCYMPGIAQKNDYKSEVIDLSININKHFYIDSLNYYKETSIAEKEGRKVAYLWPLCALFEAYNEMEKVVPKTVLTAKTFQIIEKYHNQFLPAPGYASYPMQYGGGTRFYDDNQWLGITAMDAYANTKNDNWLTVGKDIYKFMMTGYDTVAGGGLYWEEGNKKSKNTCSNGPGIILALQLYKATKNRTYLDTALLLYNWVNTNLQSAAGLYYDNLNLTKKIVDKRLYSYNTGTMLQSAVYLYECTDDKKYLHQAISIADSSVKYFLGNKKFKDDYWFSAVLLRGYQHLLQHNKDEKYIIAFKACLDEALANNKNANGLMGNNKPLNLVAQGGMLEILARFSWLQQNSFFINQ